MLVTGTQSEGTRITLQCSANKGVTKKTAEKEPYENAGNQSNKSKYKKKEITQIKKWIKRRKGRRKTTTKKEPVEGVNMVTDPFFII